MAEKYFSDTDPIGQTLIYEDRAYRVTGVVEDIPSNTHFPFDFLARLDRAGGRWFMFDAYTYLTLHAGTNQQVVQDKLSNFIEAHIDPQLSPGSFGELHLQPLSRIHLHSNLANEMVPNSDVRYLYLFSLVALLVLLIACINYMNLATARSSGRAREVGMRKVLGAHRMALARQFLGESLLTALMALLLGLALASLSLPLLNDLTGKPLTLAALGFGWLLGFGVLVVLLVGVLSGLYPAFYLSRFRPIRVLRGAEIGSSGLGFRKLLVVTQFAASVVFLMATVVIYNQLHFLQNERLGFDKEHVVVVSDWNACSKKLHQLQAGVAARSAYPLRGCRRCAYPKRGESAYLHR